MDMPATNTELRKETRSDLPDLVPRPGCLYTGPTQITFGPTAGQMTVKSPWTKFTNITGDPAAPTSGNNANSAQCGTIAALSSAAGATLSVLVNNVIFVQNIPLTGVNSATTAETTTTTAPANCRTSTGTTIATTTAGFSQNVVGYPTATEKPLIGGTTATASYGCRNGDLFVSGTDTGGAITLAAQNYVYVTGDLRYGSNDTDMIGLVGQNAVWVYNPVHYSTGSFLLGNNRRIDAAILSVAHTFAVQHYDTGSARGTLTVFGSIAQKYRGTVGQGSAGYLKNYLYDARFKFTAPPKFLAPASTTYGINVWIEIEPVYRVDGCYRERPPAQESWLLTNANGNRAHRPRRRAWTAYRVIPQRSDLARTARRIDRPSRQRVPALRSRHPLVGQHSGDLLASSARQVSRLRSADLVAISRG